MVVLTGPAEAMTVRPGARPLQIDVLLDGTETERARRDLWAATVYYWNAGVVGKVLALGPCQTMMTVCAARAYYATPRKWAGITFSSTSSWCWTY